MRILIIGGAGYVGNALTQQLVQNEKVTAIRIYDNLSKGRHFISCGQIKSEKIAFIEGDILDTYLLEKAIKDTDIIVHLGTINNAANHHQLEQVNHWGTANLCNLITENSIQKFVFLSTIEIFENKANTIITNETAAHPQTAWAKSMLRAENYVKTLKSKCDIAIIRSSSCYGYNPAMSFSEGINKHFFEAKYNKLLQIDADGVNHQSAIHIDDLATLLSKISLSNISQENYIAATEKWSAMEIYEKLQKNYPNLEATFTSHHLRLPDTEVKMDDKSLELLGTTKSLEEAIHEFNERTNY